MAGLSGLSGERKAAALAGFIMLGASPSFIDWEQSPDKRKQIIVFYAGAIALFYWGLLR